MNSIETEFPKQVISFLNITLEVILADDEERYMSVPAICKALNIQHKPQIRRIRRNAELNSGLRTLILWTNGGQQPVSCLQVKKVCVWLEDFQMSTLNEHQKKNLTSAKGTLVNLAYTTFPGVPIFPNSKKEEEPSFLCETEDTTGEELTDDDLTEESAFTWAPEIPAFALPAGEQIALLQNLALTKPQNHLLITSTAQDAAFRESCLSDADGWVTNGTAPYFVSSDNIMVYLEHPSHVIAHDEAKARIRGLGETTVMTARIATGLWWLRRKNPALVQENGSVPISPEEILAWRSISKHSREAFPGATTRVTEGFERKYYDQVSQDFVHLQDCYMISAQGTPIKLDGPYAHVTMMRGQRTLWGKPDDVICYLYAPGGWISSPTGQALSQLGVTLQRVFELRPRRQKYALRIALYLIERWSQLAARGDFDEPICMKDLLTASVIDIDATNASRFCGMIERAILKTLTTTKILGRVEKYVPPFAPSGTILEQFLSTYWKLPPHEEVIDQYQMIKQADTRLFLPASIEKKKKSII